MSTLYEIHVEVEAPFDLQMSDAEVDAREAELMDVLAAAAQAWCEDTQLPLTVAVTR